MNVNLVFVPPGGGEADYSLSFELPAIPQSGDYIMVQRGAALGAETFVVKRTWWSVRVDENGDRGSVTEISVECEFADWSMSSKSHKDAVKRYEDKTGKRLEFDDSMY